MNNKTIAASAALLLAAASPSFAAPVTLGFEGANNGGFVTNFYNGGTDLPSNESSQDPASGTNYGISFGGGFMALANDEFFTYFTNAPSATVVTSVDANDALMSATGNYSFMEALSFSYSANEAFTLRVLDASNFVLATFDLAATNGSCATDSPFCVWAAATLNFEGVAKAFDFGDSTYIAAFDNIAVSEVPVPAAGWLLASGLAALSRMRRKRVA
jgi:hypothetical protein